MKKFILLLGFSFVLFAGGCSLSKENQCLDTVRLGFKDPDSAKVIKNLGSRGINKEDFFWLRYSAKNSYGAYVSSNMACHKSDGKWLRDEILEAKIRAEIYIQKMAWARDLMHKNNERIKECKTSACADDRSGKPWPRYADGDGLLPYLEAESEKEATSLLEDSLLDIPNAYLGISLRR